MNLAETPQQARQRLFPHDQAVERAVLGAIMLEPSTFETVNEILYTEEGFYIPGHQVTYRAMIEVKKRGLDPDFETVCSELNTTGNMAKAGGFDTVSGHLALVTGSKQVGNHANKILEYWCKRTFIELGNQMIQYMAGGSMSIQHAVEKVDNQLGTIMSRILRDKPVSIGEAVMIEIKYMAEQLKLKAEAEARGETHLTTRGLTMGYQDFDSRTHGVEGGELFVIGGRPGDGKTALGTQFGVEVALQGIPVVMYSQEMKVRQIARRYISLRSQSVVNGQANAITYPAMKSLDITGEQWKQIVGIGRSAQNMPFLVRDTRGLSIREIKADVRELHRNGKCGLIIIDYLQLITPTRNPGSKRYEQVGEIADGLKEIAGILDIPVIALSQLKRPVEFDKPQWRRAKGKPAEQKYIIPPPKNEDHAECSKIEATADLMVNIYRPNRFQQTEDGGQDQQGFELCHLILSKNRNGPVGWLPSWWWPQAMCYMPRQREIQGEINDPRNVN